MAGQPEAREVEEHYILRVKDQQLAEQIRAVLRGENDDRHGKFLFNGQEYPLAVLNLPAVSETYKTYDDVNYVKITDVGQVLVVSDPTSGKAPSQGESRDASDGITPPLRNARARVFKRQYDVQPDLVSTVEHNLLTILAGGAPEGTKFVDYEEEYRINEATGLGEWVPVKR
ncbi:hypothetical protein N2152v2_009598 [Parachlorella kessleri]